MKFEAMEPRLLMDGGPVSLAGLRIQPSWFAELLPGQDTSSGGGAGANDVSNPVDALSATADRWVVQLSDLGSAIAGTVAGVNSVLHLDSLGAEVVRGLGLIGMVLIQARAGADSTLITQALASSTFVDFHEVDSFIEAQQTFPDDTSVNSQWGMHNTGQFGGTPDADIDAPEAWDITRGSSSVVVGVIDTGVDYTHEDIAPNLWVNPGEIAGNGIDDDGNGFIDDMHGWNFVLDNNTPMDDNGHGTHVAGIIAAAGNNAKGVTGVSMNSKLMVLKFLSSSGTGSLSNAVRAINYATLMRTNYGVNVRVLNNSWSGTSFTTSLSTAIRISRDADILFVAAAGNDTENNDTFNSYPSKYTFENIIAVGASRDDEMLATFSNYGLTSVDLVAPGQNILSTKKGGGYQYRHGTSMASPFVAGAAALAWSLVPNATYSTIRDAILGSVDVKAAYQGKVATGGRLNVYNMLVALGGVPTGSPDAYEENDSSAAVAAKTPGGLNSANLGLLTVQTTITNLNTQDDPTDWFRFQMDGPGSAEHFARINFSNNQGDLNLALYASNGTTLLGSSTTTADVESISLAGLAAGVYFLKVSAVAGAINPAYSLTINPAEPKDAYEENDSQAVVSLAPEGAVNSPNLGLITSTRVITNLDTRADYNDWYRFRMDGTGTASSNVRIDFQHLAGNIDLSVYNGSGALVAHSNTSNNSSNFELVSLDGQAAGYFWVRVYSAIGVENSYSLTINPAPPPPPAADLTGNYQTIDNSTGYPLGGAMPDVTLNLANSGTAPAAGSVTVKLYLSANQALSTTWDTLIGTQTVNVNLAGGGALPVTFGNLTVPSGLAAGAYYLIAALDTENTISESSESNNTVLSTQTLTFYSAQADLTIAMADPGIASPLVAGQTLPSIPVTITNLGSTVVNGPTTVKLFWSADGEYSESDTLLGSASVNLNIGAGQSVVHTFTELTVPMNAASGTYRLIVGVDTANTLAEANESNNFALGDFSLTVHVPMPDLAGSIGTLAGATAIRTGATLSDLPVTLSNLGTGAATGSVALKLYLSSNQALSTTWDTLIGTQNVNLNLAASASQVVTFSGLTIPAGLVAGVYYMIVAVDADGALAESSESNNTLLSVQTLNITQPVADLTGAIGSLNLSSTYQGGQPLPAVPLTVSNTGDASATGTVQVKLWLSSNASLETASDMLLGTLSQAVNLAPGASTAYNFTGLTLPEPLLPGVYHLIAQIDSASAIAEGSESNNLVLAPSTLSIISDSTDIVITLGAAGFAESALPGDRAAIPVTLTNISDTTVNGQYRLAFYLSTDGTLDDSDLMLKGTSLRTINLASGASTTLTTTVGLPYNLQPGQYRLLAKAELVGIDEQAPQAANNLVVSAQIYDIAWKFGTFGDRVNASFTVTDPQGTPIGFHMDGPGYGLITLGASGLIVNLFDTTSQTQVSLTTPSGRQTVLQSVTVHGDLGRFSAPVADMIGDFTVEGSLAFLHLDDVIGPAAINLQDASDTTGPVILLDYVLDLSIHAAGAIQALLATEWLNTDSLADVVQAGKIGTLRVTGSASSSIQGRFQADLDLTGMDGFEPTLGSVIISGDVTGTTWDVAGRINYLLINSEADNWTLNADSASVLRIRSALDGNLNIAESIDYLLVGRWNGGHIITGTLGWLNVVGDSTTGLAGEFSADLTLNTIGEGGYSMSLATVSGGVQNATWNIAGAVGLIYSGGLNQNWDVNARSFSGFVVDRAEAINLTTTGGIDVLLATSWLGGSITGQSLMVLMVTGDDLREIQGNFSANLNLSGDPGSGLSDNPVLGSAIIVDEIAGGRWAVAGDIDLITAQSTSQSWILQARHIKTLVVGELSGSITADSLQSAVVVGDVANATIALTQQSGGEVDPANPRSLGSLRVGGWIDHSTLRTAGSIGVVEMGGSRNSSILAGVSASISQLPSTSNDLVNPASVIDSLSILGNSSVDRLVNSNFAAGSFGHVELGKVRTANSGARFGLATRQIGRLGYSNQTSARLIENSITPVEDGDFILRIL